MFCVGNFPHKKQSILNQRKQHFPKTELNKRETASRRMSSEEKKIGKHFFKRKDLFEKFFQDQIRKGAQ